MVIRLRPGRPGTAPGCGGGLFSAEIDLFAWDKEQKAAQTDRGGGGWLRRDKEEVFQKIVLTAFASRVALREFRTRRNAPICFIDFGPAAAPTGKKSLKESESFR